MDEQAARELTAALSTFTQTFGWGGSSRLPGVLQNSADMAELLTEAINNHAEAMREHTDALNANTAAINAQLSAQQ